MENKQVISEERSVLYSVNPTAERKLLLAKLQAGIPALTPTAGAYMVEACLVCFESQGHDTGVQLAVGGTYTDSYQVIWEGEVTSNMRRYWKDEEVTTEQAAYGIAILLVRELTGYTAIERASKGPGFDYWIGTTEEDLPFQNMARLEISGIRKGNEKTIEQRIKQKIRQTDRSDGVFPAYVAVIEFSKPVAQVVKKK